MKVPKQATSRTLLAVFILVLLYSSCQTLYTSKMANELFSSHDPQDSLDSPPGIKVETICNTLNLSSSYNYNGIVRSGYLTVGKGNSALAFIFYGRKDISQPSQLKNIPTIIWLNGGPGSSSQIGNFQELGPLIFEVAIDAKIKQNNYTWANKYNLLFVDQPVGTGLSYADTGSGSPFATSLDDVAKDFYAALYELYNGKGCFSPDRLNIPPSSPIVFFGESYAGKYVPAIAKKIIDAKESGGFLTGLKGIAIGDGFTFPEEIFSQVGTFSYNLGFLDFQQRMKLQKILLNSTRHSYGQQWNDLHLDFDNALEYIVKSAGGINVYDIKKDGEYLEVLKPYFLNQSISAKIYQFIPEIIYNSQSDDVYQKLYNDFMKPASSLVEYLLSKKLPVLIYNGQDDLIVPSPGTMRWVDRLQHEATSDFRKRLFTPWKINEEVVGLIKTAGNLELRIVNNAGHLVPMDKPVEALDMAISFVQRVVR